MDDFDFVIVGAGSAGCVLAERLSVSGRHKVLLIEQGPKDDHWLLSMPQGFGRTIMDPRFASHYVTARERHPDDPPEIWVRGRALGGSSSVNGMVWVRGQPEDYDRIAELGNRGWSWTDVAPYFKRLETYALGEDEVHGARGPVSVRIHPHRTRLADAFIAAGEALSVPYKDDLNRPDQEGVGYLQINVDAHGRRSSAARAFLKPAARRANVSVITDARVERVLFEGRRAIGVVLRRNGQLTEIRTQGEVILSAGGLASPKILQLSGVGAAGHLQSLGVPVVYDNPGVGANLREHFLLTLQYRLREARDSHNREYSGWRLLANVLRYAATGKGLMSEGSHTAAAFTRSNSGLNRPDAQIMFAPYSTAADKNGVRFEPEPGMNVFGYLLRPESQGWIKITSSDPSEPPQIHPQFFASEADRTGSVEIVRRIRRLMTTPQMTRFVERELPPTAAAQTDDEILAAFARYGNAGLHACGTCAMGQGPASVVDERLRVRGVGGLRVMDTSIFPEMLSGNTNAPTMALAWRAADLILEDRGSPQRA